MNPRNLRKAIRIAKFVKIAKRMLKRDIWNDGFPSYRINSQIFHRRELIVIVDKNINYLRKLLK